MRSNVSRLPGVPDAPKVGSRAEMLAFDQLPYRLRLVVNYGPTNLSASLMHRTLVEHPEVTPQAIEAAVWKKIRAGLPDWCPLRGEPLVPPVS